MCNAFFIVVFSHELAQTAMAMVDDKFTDLHISRLLSAKNPKFSYLYAGMEYMHF